MQQLYCRTFCSVFDYQSTLKIQTIAILLVTNTYTHTNYIIMPQIVHPLKKRRLRHTCMVKAVLLMTIPAGAISDHH